MFITLFSFITSHFRSICTTPRIALHYRTLLYVFSAAPTFLLSIIRHAAQETRVIRRFCARHSFLQNFWNHMWDFNLHHISVAKNKNIFILLSITCYIFLIHQTCQKLHFLSHLSIQKAKLLNFEAYKNHRLKV